jgi:hypothetical protein
MLTGPKEEEEEVSMGLHGEKIVKTACSMACLNIKVQTRRTCHQPQ